MRNSISHAIHGGVYRESLVGFLQPPGVGGSVGASLKAHPVHFTLTGKAYRGSAAYDRAHMPTPRGEQPVPLVGVMSKFVWCAHSVR